MQFIGNRETVMADLVRRSMRTLVPSDLRSTRADASKLGPRTSRTLMPGPDNAARTASHRVCRRDSPRSDVAPVASDDPTCDITRPRRPPMTPTLHPYASRFSPPRRIRELDKATKDPRQSPSRQLGEAGRRRLRTQRTAQLVAARVRRPRTASAGAVNAARDWARPGLTMVIRPALPLQRLNGVATANDSAVRTIVTSPLR